MTSLYVYSQIWEVFDLCTMTIRIRCVIISVRGHLSTGVLFPIHLEGAWFLVSGYVNIYWIQYLYSSTLYTHYFSFDYMKLNVRKLLFMHMLGMQRLFVYFIFWDNLHVGLASFPMNPSGNYLYGILCGTGTVKCFHVKLSPNMNLT